MDINIKHKKYFLPRKYWPWVGSGMVVAAVLAWAAIGGITTAQHVDRRGIHVAQVRQTLFNDYVSLDGTAVPVNVVQISSEEGGVVVEKVADEGSYVHRGDVIVRLSNASLDLQILNAESELAEKQNMLRNTQISMEQEALNNRNDQLQQDMEVERKRRGAQHMQALYKEQLVSREECLQATEDYDLARKRHQLITQRIQQDKRYRKTQTGQMADNLDNMRRNLQMVHRRKDNLNVRAAIDGEVGTLDVVQGQSIAPGQKLGVINDMRAYKVQALCSEHYIDRVHKGLTASFAQGGHTYRLTVGKVLPEVKNGLFKVELFFAGHSPASIRTGQTFYIDLLLGQPKQATVIPKGSFFSTTGGTWIYVLSKDGHKAYRRNITLGRQNPQYYEVLEGLEPGEKVITSGYEAFKDSETLAF